jgi:hypothetical protein
MDRHVSIWVVVAYDLRMPNAFESAHHTENKSACF